MTRTEFLKMAGALGDEYNETLERFPFKKGVRENLAGGFRDGATNMILRLIAAGWLNPDPEPEPEVPFESDPRD